ncbi:MAG: hypothetical protein QM743_06245 [Chitinophagaceae bacterium]
MKYLIPLMLILTSLTEACSEEQHPADLTSNTQKKSAGTTHSAASAVVLSPLR